MNLEVELQEKAERLYLRQRSQQKKKYDYARSAGFTAQESAILQNWGWAKIAALVQERGLAKICVG